MVQGLEFLFLDLLHSQYHTIVCVCVCVCVCARVGVRGLMQPPAKKSCIPVMFLSPSYSNTFLFACCSMQMCSKYGTSTALCFVLYHECIYMHV